MNEGRRAFERLHQVRRQRLLEQHRHGAVRLEVGGADRLAIARIGDDDIAEPLLEIVDVARQAKDRHDFRCNRDVKTVFARKNRWRRRRVTTRSSATRDRSCPSRGATPRGADRCRAHCPNRCGCRAARRADYRRSDGVKVAGEVEIDILHRHDLGIAAAGGAALDAERRAERRLAQAQHRLLADVMSASVRPTVVVVLPSPAGVGVMAETRISLPFGLLCSDLTKSIDTLAL